MAAADARHSIKLTPRYNSTSAMGTPTASRARLMGSFSMRATMFMTHRNRN